MLDEVDRDLNGIDFPEFLHLMRLFSDNLSKEKLQKERSAVKETAFSMDELKEFRKVFRMYDVDRNGTFDFEELQQMIAVLVPHATGHKATKQLMNMMIEMDEDGTHTLDFPEFLLLMKKILKENWQNITGAD